MNTTTVVIFGIGAILIYTASRGDGAGGYNPVTLIRGVLSGKYAKGVPEKPKNPSGFDLNPTHPSNVPSRDKYNDPRYPI